MSVWPKIGGGSSNSPKKDPTERMESDGIFNFIGGFGGG